MMGKTGLAAALYFSLVFAGGAVVGGVGYRLYSASAKADSGPSQYRQKYMDEMKGRLSLTADQTTRIEAILDEVLAGNAAMVAEYKAGKERAFNALVGQCMKASRGKANPAQVNELLKKKLG